DRAGVVYEQRADLAGVCDPELVDDRPARVIRTDDGVLAFRVCEPDLVRGSGVDRRDPSRGIAVYEIEAVRRRVVADELPGRGRGEPQPSVPRHVHADDRAAEWHRSRANGAEHDVDALELLRVDVGDVQEAA